MRGLAALLLMFGAVSALADARHCHNLVRLTDLNYAIEPGHVIPADGDMPAYCHVRGVINRAIRFEVTMPLEGWNGRFMFSTVGGAAGVIGDVTSLLPRGFAMASTDTGHELSEGNAFLRQPEALLDYAYRGVHLATVAAKSVVQAYYDRSIDYSYLSGCSNGGRAALMEVTRFPTDYDGVIAGAPVYGFHEFIPWAITVARAMEAHPLTKDSLELLARNSADACDALDGVQDGVINDPRRCTVDRLELDKLVCDGRAAANCLTDGQLQTVRTIYQDLENSNGEVVSPGVAPGAENAGDWAFWILPNAQFGGQSVVGGMEEFLSHVMRNDPTFDIEAYDPANDGARIARELAPLDADDPDLSDFEANGGKLIIYQGWNDFPLRPQRAIDHLASVEAVMGGANEVDDFFRLFMVPGMTHCAGGPGAWLTDYVAPLVAWREEGDAPERIVGAHPATPMAMPHLDPGNADTTNRSFTRPQCVYPQLAEYRGRGDTDDAQSFECR